MSVWKEFKFDEIFEFASGLSKSRDQFGFGYEFLSYMSIFDNYFVPKELGCLVNSNEKERKSCSIKRGDIFLTRTSETDEELGISSVALKDYPDATFNGFTKRLRPKGIINLLPEYAGFYFRSPKFRATIRGMSSMTTRASLNNEMLSYLSILLPPIETQKSVAEILLSLHLKIDLLHRQNKTLEKLAETLFRQWFGESKKLKIKSEKIGNVVEFLKGRKPNQVEENYFEGSIPQLLIETFDTGKTFFTKNNGVLIANEKDILMVMDGASSGRVEIGFTGAVGSTIGLFKPKIEFDFPLFLFHFLKSNEAYIKENTTGSAIPHADKALILDLNFPLSDKKEILEFENIATTWFEKTKANRNQIRTLTQLRDTLLPKLMSGEVKVK